MCDSVGVKIANEEGELKKEHGRCPDTRGPAEAGKDRLYDHRLNEEEESGTEEDGAGEQDSVNAPGHGKQ